MAEARRDEKQAESRREKANQQTGAAGDNIRSMTDAGSQMAGSAADIGQRAAQTGVEMIDRNKEVAQQLWEHSTELASHFTRQWTDQFGRTMGISGDGPESIANRASRSFEALAQSRDVITSASREVSREWFGTARRMMDATMSRSEKVASCRTPSDLWAMQLEILRDGFEAALQGAKRISEISAQAATEASQKMSEVTKHAA